MATTRFVITQQPIASVPSSSVEFCEHKGIGHPDSLCDGVAEAVSRTLCRAYLKCYGTIQHYNVDKALLIGGQSAPKFGGGTIVTPLRLIVCGRATPIRDIDLAELVEGSAKEYLASVLHCSTDLFVIESAVRAGSPNLVQVVGSAVAKPRANDTSFGCGFAPPSRLEKVVLRVAETLGSPDFRQHFPAAGDDYKVMGARVGDVIDLTIAIAIVDRWVRNIADYFKIKRDIVSALGEGVGSVARIELNALDDPAAVSESGVYTTVSGLSAEHGDDGQVGRGNRANGLITPQRTMSLEATAGKNSAAHVGKLYNLLAFEIATAIVREHPEVCDASVQLLSTIGRWADEPSVVAIVLRTEQAGNAGLEASAQRIAASLLGQLAALTERLVEGSTRVF
jgi:S-adenosylmethionine synthetase